ncbi:uncharacterized protein LOC108829457 [Raphanus sativus]|uniref:Uncharacterized protein LOC108829457 n=1 Tax=Raphanus sativus TaxID=3726 RepID=A0A6J0LGK1_RAPSA|nr:uncharacterized protein LOC108829457 [Raphanus sativus]
MSVRAPVSLDDALHRASFFAAYEEDVANLKEQFLASKNAARKKTSTTKEAPTKGQHSYAIDNSTKNKSSTVDLNKHYDFHKRKGHSTEECRAALREKERREEEENSQEDEPPSTPKSDKKPKTSSYKRAREVEAESPNSPPPAPKKRVDMISLSTNRRDRYDVQGLDQPHDDALVLRLDVGGCELSRIMIDTGSSADVLFYDAFKRMGFTKTLLKQEPTPLIGFTGETTYSLGSIELAVTTGDVRKIVEFIVIDRPAPFNAILGRPWLYSMKAV